MQAEEMKKEEFGYYSKTVSEEIGIGTDTLRTWSLKLEAEGVEFERNKRNQRIYYEIDIRMLKNMKEIMDLNHPLAETAKTIAKKREEGSYDTTQIEKNEEITPSVFEVKNEVQTQEKQLDIFKETLLQEFEKTQKQQLEEFKDQIVSETTQKMQDVFESSVEQAVKTALASERKRIEEEVTKEIAAAEEKKEKENIFSRFFRFGKKKNTGEK